MRKDQQLSEKYKKNQRFEEVITSLNRELEKSQPDLLHEVSEDFSTIHILGAPRSGTTLLSQLIPSFLEVAHINNFIAAFWKAPIYGIELSKKLITEKYKSSFTSDFGRTNHIHEPHEFGYFWNYHLKYTELYQQNENHETKIDWAHLSHLLKNMTHSFGKPIVFKSFLMGFHAKKLHESLPKTKFIYLKRNLADNVKSIKKLRQRLNGDINAWGSIKPKQYDTLKSLAVEEQIVGQILCLENEYLKQLEHIPQQNQMIIRYEDLCQNPGKFLNAIHTKFLGDKTDLPLEALPDFKSVSQGLPKEELQKINDAKDRVLELFPNLKTLEN